MLRKRPREEAGRSEPCRSSVSDLLNFYEAKEGGIYERLRSVDAFHGDPTAGRYAVKDEDVKPYGNPFAADQTFRDEEEEESEGLENSGAFKDNSNEEAEDRMEYKYSCARCSKSYKRKGNLIEHQKIFCGKDKQQCCPYCVFREPILWDDYQVFDPSAAVETTDFRPERYGGSYFAGRKPARTFRAKMMDPVGGRYRCSKCSKSYRWKHHLVEHVKAFCGQKKDACCPYCSYRSSRKWNLKSHMKRIHADV